MRNTKMLKREEVAEDLGVSIVTVDLLVQSDWLHPTFLGHGWKFSQEDILEFQRLSRGLDIRNIAKMVVEREQKMILREQDQKRNYL